MLPDHIGMPCSRCLHCQGLCHLILLRADGPHSMLFADMQLPAQRLYVPDDRGVLAGEPEGTAGYVNRESPRM